MGFFSSLLNPFKNPLKPTGGFDPAGIFGGRGNSSAESGYTPNGLGQLAQQSGRGYGNPEPGRPDGLMQMHNAPSMSTGLPPLQGSPNMGLRTAPPMSGPHPPEVWGGMQAPTQPPMQWGQQPPNQGMWGSAYQNHGEIPRPGVGWGWSTQPGNPVEPNGLGWLGR